MTLTPNKPQYTIENTINGLTITWRGRKRWLELIAYSSVCCYGGFVIIKQIFEILSAPPDSVGFFGSLLLFSLMFYVFYYLFMGALNGLFDQGKIIIAGDTIQAQKYGFGPVKWEKIFSTNGKMCFFHSRNEIIFHQSKQLGKLFHYGFIRTTTIHPLRRFLWGTTGQDAIAVLERIKARYPNYDIYYRGYKEAGLDR